MPPVWQTASRRSPSTRSAIHPPASRLERVRSGVRQLFSGQSAVGTASSPPESPKTPRLALGLNNLSLTRLVIPHLSRPTLVHSPQSPQSLPPATASDTAATSHPFSPSSLLQQPDQPNIFVLPSRSRHNSTSRFVDPAEQQLAELVNEGRQRRNKTHQTNRRCGPKIKSKKIRSRILGCFISGLFLIVVLSIYLALVLAAKSVSQEFRVLLILIILVTSMFFCYSLIRLCMTTLNPSNETDWELQLPQMVGPGGYANPETPIRVALARDEEAVGIQSEATKYPPPAYGLWRESVRVDPNRLFWQRNEAVVENQNIRTAGRPQTANRPPSYISEDGVHYVLEAQPRSIAPTTDVPLPPHPSERRRWPAA